MSGPKILVLDFEPSSRIGTELSTIVESSIPGIALVKHDVAEANEVDADVSARLSLLLRFDPDLVFIVPAAGAGRITGAVISRLQSESSDLPVIVVGNFEQPDEMLALLSAGAADFIVPPLKTIDIIPRIRRLLDSDNRVPEKRVKAALGLKQLIGKSQVFLAEINKIPTVARCDATVLISGETGTGKELCARAIHYLSPRAKQPFVPINCGAIPAELAENELFGHERGAYTGAGSSQTGLIQEADGGTLFLDEIDCLSQLTQVKLLRFLQEREYRPLGSSRIRRADVRIIAAANTDLEESVRQGRMRQDLFYRINVVPLTLAPLRARTDDIPLLANHFLNLHSIGLKKGVDEISPEALQKLMLHDWPGNVRELEHVIERAVVMCDGNALREEDIKLSNFQQSRSHCSFHEGKAQAVSEFERNYIRRLLIACGGNITKAAKAANKNRRAFWELIRKHRIDVSSFKSGPSRSHDSEAEWHLPITAEKVSQAARIPGGTPGKRPRRGVRT